MRDAWDDGILGPAGLAALEQVDGLGGTAVLHATRADSARAGAQQGLVDQSGLAVVAAGRAGRLHSPYESARPWVAL